MHKLLATFLVFTSIVAHAEGGRPKPIHTIDTKDYFCTMQTAGGKTAELKLNVDLSGNSNRQVMSWNWEENVNVGQPTFVLREELLTNLLKGRTDLAHMPSGTYAGKPNTSEVEFWGAGGLRFSQDLDPDQDLQRVPIIKDQVRKKLIPLKYTNEEFDDLNYFMIRVKENVDVCENCDIAHISVEGLETNLKITPDAVAELFELQLQVKLTQNMTFDGFTDKDGKEYNGKPVSTLFDVLKRGDTALAATGTCRLL